MSFKGKKRKGRFILCFFLFIFFSSSFCLGVYDTAFEEFDSPSLSAEEINGLVSPQVELPVHSFSSFFSSVDDAHENAYLQSPSPLRCGTSSLSCRRLTPICCEGNREREFFCLPGGMKCCASLNQTGSFGCSQSEECCVAGNTAICCPTGSRCTSTRLNNSMQLVPICMKEDCAQLLTVDACLSSKSKCGWCCEEQKCIRREERENGTTTKSRCSAGKLPLQGFNESCPSPCSMYQTCRHCSRANIVEPENQVNSNGIAGDAVSGASKVSCSWCLSSASCVEKSLLKKTCGAMQLVKEEEQCTLADYVPPRSYRTGKMILFILFFWLFSVAAICGIKYKEELLGRSSDIPRAPVLRSPQNSIRRYGFYRTGAPVLTTAVSERRQDDGGVCLICGKELKPGAPTGFTNSEKSEVVEARPLTNGANEILEKQEGEQVQREAVPGGTESAAVMVEPLPTKAVLPPPSALPDATAVETVPIHNDSQSGICSLVNQHFVVLLPCKHYLCFECVGDVVYSAQCCKSIRSMLFRLGYHFNELSLINKLWSRKRPSTERELPADSDGPLDPNAFPTPHILIEALHNECPVCNFAIEDVFMTYRLH